MDGHTRIATELHDLLDKAMEFADQDSLARLHDLLVYMSEGADLVDYTCDVPEGLEHKAVFKRMAKVRELMDVPPMGRA
jgi:hypothetical protein